jgi:hypothetical protein
MIDALMPMDCELVERRYAMKRRAIVVAIVVSLAPWALAADPRQELSTGPSRIAQATEQQTPEPAPPPFTPIPPGGPTSPQSPVRPPGAADPTGERGVAMLHQLVGQQEAGSRDLSKPRQSIVYLCGE